MTKPLLNREENNNETLISGNPVMPRLIAFYLTQFHPIPENDLWWGKGFTEWTNVTKSEPMFEGHYQPHLPTDFGFYDLRVRDVRRDQIKVAKEFGIDGFCYHYYWFSGRRILNQPLDDMLSDPESDMPFCLCWANENWTRRWDAADHEVLIAQEYLPEDDLDFIKSLVPFFEDKRYIRVDEKPFLIVYRAQHLPNARRTVERWRDYCRSIGLGEIHVCAALTHGNEDYTQFGFDSGVEFPPHNLRSGNINNQLNFHSFFRGNVIDYADIALSFINRVYKSKRVFKTVFPSWDNTARTKERALVVNNGVPENYEYWLSLTIDFVKEFNRVDDLLFINAWNEWAEGCHLEPDRKFGHRFLEATLNAKNGRRSFSSFPVIGLTEPEKVPLISFWSEVMSVVSRHIGLKVGILKLFVNRRPWLRELLLFLIREYKKFKGYEKLS